MSKNRKIKQSTIDRNKLPPLFPTHKHTPQFWEQLGRTIATFGVLEEVLGKAIFAFTATREYDSDEINAAYQKWPSKLEKALTDPLGNLADVYGKAVREHQDYTIENIDELIRDIKEATKFRNVLCHGSWSIPDENGKSLPRFINNNNEIFETSFDIESLHQLQKHVAELICSVIDTVTRMGWAFPGIAGSGEEI